VPRSARPMLAGVCVHIVTRGNARATIFRSENDYGRFSELITSAQDRVHLELFAWCLMPNHIHLVARPRTNHDLTKWMHWLLTTHAQRHRTRYATTGHIWQGRYKVFPIQVDAHFIRVLRYVERNPVRASLVASSRDWRWSSLARRRSTGECDAPLAESPVPLPVPWDDWVNAPLTEQELAAIRTSVRRGRPLGDPGWARGASERLGVQDTLNPRGRPGNL
jgi:putative transposase